MPAAPGASAVRAGRHGGLTRLRLLLPLALLAAAMDRAAALGEAQGYEADARGTYKKTVEVAVQEGAGAPGQQMVGKGYLVTFKEAACAEDAECYEPVQEEMKTLGCEAFTRYEALNMMGAICFSPAVTTNDFGLATVKTFRALQQNRRLKGVSVNARVQLNPKDPDAVWGLWRPRNPRERPRWGWGRSPAPAPRNDPAPSPPSGGGGGGGGGGDTSEPIQQQPKPDPSIYNWGLDRSNQEAANLDKNNAQCPSRGRDVTIFILDTGCRASHNELRGRATTESAAADGRTFFDSGADGNGHGTHCAGTAAGKNVGIAPGATVRCIKVLGNDGSGMLDHVVAGINMVGTEKRRSPDRAMVASMSLGASASTAGRVNDAVNALSQLGVPVVAAAGNSNEDARNTVPASADGVLTVGAIDERDAKASYSNYGSAVELWAPGSNIYSSSNSGDGQYKTMSGTSMATPAVAGGVACLMAADPRRVCSTRDTWAAQRLASAMTSTKSPDRRFGDPQINQKIFYVPTDRNVACPDS